MSKEHIFPMWLQKEFDIERSEIAATHQSIIGFPISQRKLTFNKFVNGLVCRSCNNGWMAQLEGDVKDSLSRLMNYDFDIAEFHDNHKLVAKWAIKTAMVLNYGTNYRRIIPQRHLRMFYRGVIPQTLSVSLSFTVEDMKHKFNWAQSPNLKHEGYDIDSDMFKSERFQDVYLISMQFKRLLLKVCYTPFLDFKYVGEGSDIEIYPGLVAYATDNKATLYTDLLDFDFGGVCKQN